MDERNIQLSPEQFKQLIAEIRQPAAGLGAPGTAGLGSGDACMGPLATGVYSMLAAGSPRLALAKAWGVPLAPYMINVSGTFPDVDTATIPQAGSDVKIVQDTLIDALVARITIDRAPKNSLQTQSDYYFNFQSGIEATLDVKGAPRYSVAEQFTPIATLCDMINGDSHWPGGWILTYQQQLSMAFNARITLPEAPVTVKCTFRAWVPTNDMFVNMTTAEAFARLAELGIVCNEAYVLRVTR